MNRFGGTLGGVRLLLGDRVCLDLMRLILLVALMRGLRCSRGGVGNALLMCRPMRCRRLGRWVCVLVVLVRTGRGLVRRRMNCRRVR